MSELAGDPKDPMYTDRVEDKFIFNLVSLDSILSEIEKHLKPDYPSKDTDYTYVRTVYLDTPELSLLQDCVLRNEPRFKLRVRCYAPNGSWEQVKYVEVKYKENDIKKKVRIKVDLDGFLKILAGQPISGKTRKLNKDMSDSDYEAAIELIQEVAGKGVSPALQVQYKRYAFRDKNTRVTVDSKVTTEALSVSKTYTPSQEVKQGLEEIGKKFNQDTQGIIEIKHQPDEPIPDWLDKLITKYKKSSEGFSKMVWGFNEVL